MKHIGRHCIAITKQSFIPWKTLEVFLFTQTLQGLACAGWWAAGAPNRNSVAEAGPEEQRSWNGWNHLHTDLEKGERVQNRDSSLWWSLMLIFSSKSWPVPSLLWTLPTPPGSVKSCWIFGRKSLWITRPQLQRWRGDVEQLTWYPCSKQNWFGVGSVGKHPRLGSRSQHLWWPVQQWLLKSAPSARAQTCHQTYPSSPQSRCMMQSKNESWKKMFNKVLKAKCWRKVMSTGVNRDALRDEAQCRDLLIHGVIECSGAIEPIKNVEPLWLRTEFVVCFTSLISQFRSV